MEGRSFVEHFCIAVCTVGRVSFPRFSWWVSLGKQNLLFTSTGGIRSRLDHWPEEMSAERNRRYVGASRKCCGQHHEMLTNVGIDGTTWTFLWRALEWRCVRRFGWSINSVTLRDLKFKLRPELTLTVSVIPCFLLNMNSVH